MALVKKEAVDKIEIVNANDIPMIQVRKTVWVEDDVTGEKFGQKYERHVCPPDHDCTHEEPIVQNIAAQVHTDNVKAQWALKKAEEMANAGNPSTQV